MNAQMDASGRAPADYAESIALPATTEAVPVIVSDSDWWAARPAGSRLVGLVVARDDLPSVIAQRDALAEFGVPIEGFRHPAPETGESWSERLTRLFGLLPTIAHQHHAAAILHHPFGRRQPHTAGPANH